jgi:hypothetical protein
VQLDHLFTSLPVQLGDCTGIDRFLEKYFADFENSFAIVFSKFNTKFYYLQ